MYAPSQKAHFALVDSVCSINPSSKFCKNAAKPTPIPIPAPKGTKLYLNKRPPNLKILKSLNNNTSITDVNKQCINNKDCTGYLHECNNTMWDLLSGKIDEKSLITSECGSNTYILDQPKPPQPKPPQPKPPQPKPPQPKPPQPKPPQPKPPQPKPPQPKPAPKPAP